MDVWSIKESNLDRFYERYGSPIGEGWTIIDIGAGLGDFTIFAAHGHPTNQVFGFEPFNESFELLKQNLRHNRIDNVQVFQMAVAGQSGQMALDLTGGEPLQIQSSGAATTIQAEGNRLLVESVSLDDLFARHKLERCDLLKLDCEGSEYQILFNASKAALRRIQRIIMEYHDDVVGYDHRQMRSFLESKGFAVKVYDNFVHKNLGYLYGQRA
jgi:FkbM family methyltransferase